MTLVKTSGIVVALAIAGVPVAAAYAFDGNKNVGRGTIEMTLHMLEPFETRNTVDFILQPRGDTTEVTRAMQGPVPHLAKIIHAGLASLKTLAEKTP